MSQARIVGGAALAAILLIGCEAQSPTETAAPAAIPIPAKVCEQVRGQLEELRKRGPFEFDQQGQATIEEQLWFGLPDAAREDLGRALAFHAACAAESPPREQTVLVRNETGITLMQRVFETAVDPAAMFADE